MRKPVDESPISNNRMAHILRYSELFPEKNLAIEMKRRFPWLGTEDDAGSGADVIQDLARWYSEITMPVCAGCREPIREDETLAEHGDKDYHLDCEPLDGGA